MLKLETMICIMAIPVVEFSREGLKINCSKIKLLNFENWSSGELGAVHKLCRLKISNF